MSRVFRRRGWSRRRVLFVVMGTGAFLLAVAGISTARWWVVISWVGHVSMTGWLAGLGVLLAAGAGGALACRKRTVRPETGGGSDVWWMSAVMIVVPVLALTGMSLVVLLAVLAMLLSLAGDLEEADFGWAVVELAVVGGAFEAVVVGAVSFDHSGICSVPSWWVGSFGDFLGGFGEGGGECFRGKSPPGW